MDLDLQRLQNMATRLSGKRHKTLVEHRWLVRLKQFWRHVEPNP